MVKEGVVVIDVGINRVDAPGTEKGFKLVGDVAFDEVKEKARGYYTCSRRGGSHDHRHAYDEHLDGCQGNHEVI